MKGPFVPLYQFLRALAILLALSVFAAWIARGAFYFSLASPERPGFTAFAESFPLSLLFDFAASTYAFLPFCLAYILAPPAFLRGSKFRGWFYGFSAIYLFCLIFGLVSEIIFFQEFHARFNFIAVDYLVYTQEVLHNIWESYPIVFYISVIVLFVAVLLFGLSKLFRFSEKEGNAIQAKAKLLALVAALGGLCFFVIQENAVLKNRSDQVAELSKNTFHALFAAYQNNQIDYDKFYAGLDPKLSTAAWCSWRKASFDANTRFAGGADCAAEIEIKDPTPPQPLNVVIFSIESMSANFMKAYGNEKNITPVLDRLTQEGLFFSNIYATGTRTVRGLEAISLSVPPTPGQSIVRRPGNDHLFSLASALRPFGYDAQFLYGGHSVFDNMKEFFEGNGFEVWDKGNLAKDEIQFANAWGVCDEDLFSLALKQADAKFAKGKKFLQLIMTTSNHRPYTFPKGKIDIEPHTGRDGAVKYTDYAIGDFLKRASTKPWFQNTLFVFVADHDASVAGGVHILPRDYKIPLIFYSPKYIKPQINPILASQMDLAPTVMGLLHFSYKSKFFGHNLMTAKKERALLATYQKVSYLENRSLIVLEPIKKVERFSLRAGDFEPEQALGAAASPESDPLAKDTVSVYQSASHLFQSGGMKEFSQ